MKKIPCIIAENVGRENAAENAAENAGRRMRDVWDVHWFIENAGMRGNAGRPLVYWFLF